MDHSRSQSDVFKQIYFAEDSIIRSAPATPSTSPTISLISLPEVDSTPPTPRISTIPLPAEPTELKDEAPVLHSALLFDPNSPTPLEFDVSQLSSLDELQRRHAEADELSIILAEPAISPAVATMTLVNNLLPYPISIMARARPHSTQDGGDNASSAVVSVFDLLAGINAFLRIPLARVEFAALPVVQAAAVATAYFARVERVPEGQDRRSEQLRGVKRADLLASAGKTGFAGLSPTKSPDVWVLHLR